MLHVGTSGLHVVKPVCLTLALVSLTCWATLPSYSSSHTNSASLVEFISLAGANAPPFATLSSAQECPILPAPASMSGSTEFNTVKAQMWIISGVWWGAFSSGGLYFYKRSGNGFAKGALIDSSGGRPDTLWNGVNLFILV